MKKITFDCDNTFGVNNCDVDDGLALLYLLGRKEANLIGITSCYGNSTIETTFSNTKRMLKEIKELNFSCDPKATLEVLTQSCPVSTATGNNCLAAYFTADEFKNRLENNKNGAGSYIYEKTGYLRINATKENANATIFLPKIKDLEAFKEEVYSGWLQAKIKIA